MESELNAELNQLIEKQTLLKAMKESCQANESALGKEVEMFLMKHFGIKKGESFTMVDLVSRLVNK